MVEQLYLGATIEGYPLESPADSLSITVATPCMMRPFTATFLERNDTAQTCLYVPKSRSSKWWDLILHLPSSNSVVFLQVSKSDLRSHDYIPPKKNAPPRYRIKESLVGGSPSLMICLSSVLSLV